ncbi:sulfotransferase [Sphingomonas sp. RB56-2]|uniref:Sulfotransferase n=1 Tax=Sphingomonas brevis TaxID=2908206 RepID=A0ABT0S7U8_9SPHN|nr:sulfotransferase [Sphingomonas brevis]MCL6740181.1 sulfotransferase [Sphingomonas brevis]
MTERSSAVQVKPGSYEEALANGFRLLDLDPSAALKQAETLVRVKRDPKTFRLAAAAYRRLDMRVDAEAAELSAIEASIPEPSMKEIAAALGEGEVVKARQLAAAIIDRDPNDLLAKTFAAEACINLWDLEQAEQLLRSVLSRAPAFLRASMLLTTCLNKQVRLREAITVIEEVAERKPRNVPALTHLSQLLVEVGDNDKAALVHERLVALEPRNAERWATLGHHYRIVGRRDDSIRALRHALGLDPSNAFAWWNLANFHPDELKPVDEESLDLALTAKAGRPEEGTLRISLGLLADRRGEHATAFEHFAAGKSVRLSNHPYDPQPISTSIDSVIETFTSEFYGQRHLPNASNNSAIFVIGMPRSGTTMVERILGRHSAIEGAGELRIMVKLAEAVRHRADNDPEHYAALLESMSKTQFSWVGERYLQASADCRRSNKPFFIDKNNLNWLHIGLILLALPNAKIIDLRRNALDCCWANFKMLFSGGFPATNDLRHVGIIYRDYVRLFDAMKIAAPGRILSVRYEEVVDDIEGQTQRMLEFLGLEYEPECIDFHLATGAVATPSSEQVRKPLNRKGIGSAERYRQWLGPLIEELGPLADDRG